MDEDTSRTTMPVDCERMLAAAPLNATMPNAFCKRHTYGAEEGGGEAGRTTKK